MLCLGWCGNELQNNGPLTAEPGELKRQTQWTGTLRIFIEILLDKQDQHVQSLLFR